MFLIRQSKPEDVSTLVKLARTVYFINLPPNEGIIASKVEQSAQAFRRLPTGVQNGKAERQRARGHSHHRGPRAGYGHAGDLFMFSVIDPDGGGVIGTSQLLSRMGGPGDPNWSMKITEKRFHSDSLRFGTTHTVAQLYGDETGPTEIGGLILDPGFRGHRLRPGRFLSFVRFHFMGLHRKIFSPRVLAEMLGPVHGEGDSAFWDAFGRKFIPVKFAEADRFCQHNRKFIQELLPKEEIYLTLLPLEVVNSVGVVGRETLPARRLLESLGFQYRGFVDPFDGGPHIDAATDEIPLVRDTRMGAAKLAQRVEDCRTGAIVSHTSNDGEFRAVECFVSVQKDQVQLPPRAMELLEISPCDEIAFTPTGKHGLQPENATLNDAPIEVMATPKPARKRRAARGKA